MANPTTYFSWVMPNSADLVTDLPADFAVFGQGVDTSMQYLLGGTTGQVLSKTSGTNMAFTWINNDQGDITGVTAGTGISVTSPTGPVPTVAIDTTVTVDKTTAQTLTNKTLTSPALTTPTISTATTNGDILYGTGSGALARLGIGTTGQVLNVASGIPAWATPSSGGMTFTSFTPTFTNFTLGNGTVYGSYSTLGDMNYVEFKVKWGSTTSASGNWRLNNLPVNGQVGASQALETDTDTFQAYCGTGGAYDNSAGSMFEILYSLNATATLNHMPLTFTTYVNPGGSTGTTVPFTWATNDILVGRVWYRKA